MKSLMLAAGIALLTVSGPAMGAAFTLGGPLSQLCYESAVARDDRPSAIEGCDRSLADEALMTRDRAATLINRGILHMIRGHDADADADFSAALKLDQGLPDAWLNKGFLRLRQNHSRDALQLIDEGIKRSPRRQALAYFARGVAYEDLGEFSSAYADLRRAHDLEPGWKLPAQYLARYQVTRSR